MAGTDAALTVPSRIGAHDLISLLAEEGSWQGWDVPAQTVGFDAEYLLELGDAARRAGTDESVITGRVRVGGRPVVLIVSEFRFLGGSIGRSAAERICRAVRRATAEQLPILAAPASGGTRMQEGTPAFVKILDIARALVDHKAAGLPYLVYLRHPSTGGVMASWGSLGHLTAAEPGALIGFLGPRIVEVLTGQALPGDIQRAERLLDRGLVDELVEPTGLSDFVARALDVLAVPAAVDMAPASDRSADRPTVDSWTSVGISRDRARPGIRELLAYADREAGPPRDNVRRFGRSAFCALVRVSGIPCVLVGYDRVAQSGGRAVAPDDLRIARRWIRLAERWGLPIVSVVDTPGAELSADAEERGMANEIARTVSDLLSATVPSVSVILGEGCGGGALALLATERVISAQHGWLSPLPLEGASQILFGSTDHTAEMAVRQHISAVDLLDEGFVDAIVPESVPAHLEPEAFCKRVVDEIGRQLRAQLREPSGRDPAGDGLAR